MPATEAITTDATEVATYELAFHVLPTVAEGEVPAVFDRVKDHLTNAGGEIFDAEAPAHLELAFEIEKYLEGRNRRFGSAYFGWVRFRIEPAAMPELMATIEAERELLRTLCVKLSKVEEANPFHFHAAVAADAKVVNVDEAAVTTAAGEVEAAPEAAAVDAAVDTDDAEPVVAATEESSETAVPDTADTPATDTPATSDDSEGEAKTV